MINGIHHVCMKTNNELDYRKTIAFYKDVLGLKVAREWKTGIMLDTGDGIIEIFNDAEDKLEIGTIRHFALSVDDVDACAKAVADAGYDVFTEPKDIVIPSIPVLPARIAFCHGPLGEEIEFFHEK